MINRTLVASISIFLLSNFSHGSDGTALGTLAESMAPGTWAELPTSGLQSAMDAPTDTGTAGHILAFANEFMWDPTTRKAFFIGGDHDGGPEEFVEYNAVTNTWSENPRPFWMSGAENQNHSYSYMAYDPRGRFWYLNYEYNTVTQTWVDHGEEGQHFSSTKRGRRAHAYIAGVGNVQYSEGAVYIFDEDGSGPWREVLPRFALGCGTCMLSNVAVDNPVTNKVLFGGSDSNDQLYLMDPMEDIRTLGPTPLAQISMNGANTSVITVDPGTGYYIVLSPSGELWEFDAEADRWTSISSSTPLSIPDTGSWQNKIIGATSTTYNVSIYVRWVAGSGSKMWLYKHSASPPVTRSKAPADLTSTDD